MISYLSRSRVCLVPLPFFLCPDSAATVIFRQRKALFFLLFALSFFAHLFSLPLAGASFATGHEQPCSPCRYPGGPEGCVGKRSQGCALQHLSHQSGTSFATTLVICVRVQLPELSSTLCRLLVPHGLVSLLSYTHNSSIRAFWWARTSSITDTMSVPTAFLVVSVGWNTVNRIMSNRMEVKCLPNGIAGCLT